MNQLSCCLPWHVRDSSIFLFSTAASVTCLLPCGQYNQETAFNNLSWNSLLGTVDLSCTVPVFLDRSCCWHSSALEIFPSYLAFLTSRQPSLGGRWLCFLLWYYWWKMVHVCRVCLGLWEQSCNFIEQVPGCIDKLKVNEYVHTKASVVNHRCDYS